MTRHLHIISHTHWDREWYLTFQQFRLRLVDLVDNLLDLLDRDEEFLHFYLDGQQIILEDYSRCGPVSANAWRSIFVRAGSESVRGTCRTIRF